MKWTPWREDLETQSVLMFLMFFRRAAVCDRLVQSWGRRCKSFDQSHRTLSSQEPAPDRLWVGRNQVLSSVLLLVVQAGVYRQSFHISSWQSSLNSDAFAETLIGVELKGQDTDL